VTIEAAASVWRPRFVDDAQSAVGSSVDPTPAPAGVPPLIWHILRSRGFSDHEAVQKWLNPSLKHLRDPFSLIDIEKAVARLVQARQAGEKIAIYADYDLDGTSALALLKRAFDYMGYKDFLHYQPSRLKEGYGLHNAALKKLRDQGVTLAVSVDLGITAVAEVAYAKTIGLEIIITDHHLPKDELPAAVAVVNPNRVECRAELGHLCGTGVAFYLVLALRRRLIESGLMETDFDPKVLLDCFAIGTLTDMVPLIDENRVLVKHGLVQLAQTQRPGLKALLNQLDLGGRPLTSQDVAIRFAPKLNALSRLELGLRPIDLYLVETEAEALALVGQVLDNNQTRVDLQKSAEREASEFCKANPPEGCIWIYSKNFHRGVVGLVATKLSQEYKLPTFIGSLEESGQIVGSVRLPDALGINALDAMEAAGDSLIQFGGHAVAAGFELREDTAQEFGQKLRNFFKTAALTKQGRTWVFDAEAGLPELNEPFMNWYDHLGPFGAHVPAPVICVRGVRLSQIKTMKGGHLRLTFWDQGVTKTGIWFSPPADHPVLVGLELNSTLDLLVEPQWNYYGGSKSIQLLVQDIKRG
jgi:single-stranded-DNA-specific exonuclease